MKILITVPKMTLPGGVTELYRILKLDSNENIEYFEVNSKKKLSILLSISWIYLKFIVKIIKCDIIHINPSFDRKSVLRDGVFVAISLLFKKKVLVYWHGWQNEFFEVVSNNRILKFFVLNTYCRVPHQIVLARKFASELTKIGYKGLVTIESNAVESNVSRVRIDLLENKQWETFTMIYLSRLVKGKGWDILLDSMEILKGKGYSEIKLLICGDGPDYSNILSEINKRNLKNIELLGHVTGTAKYEFLQRSSVCFFPTCYPEGMPMTLLEATVYGLPIITRNEGGISDHLVNGVNGFILDSKNPEHFVEKIIDLYKNHSIYRNMSDANLKLGQEKFTKERLNERLFSYYETLYKNKFC